MNNLTLDNSMLQSYNECQKQFYWRYVKNLTPVTDNKDFFIGRLIHKVCEEISNKLSVEQVINNFTNEWNLHPEFHEVPKKSYAECIELINKFNSLYHKQLKNYNITKTEHKISKQLTKNIWLTGKIDGICYFNDILYNIEYKTTSILTENFKNSFNYSSQVTTYSYLLSNKFKNIGTFIILLPFTKSECELFTTIRTPLQLQVFKQSVIAISKDIYNKLHYKNRKILFRNNYSFCGGIFPSYQRCRYYELCYNKPKDIKTIISMLYKKEKWVAGGTGGK